MKIGFNNKSDFSFQLRNYYLVSSEKALKIETNYEIIVKLIWIQGISDTKQMIDCLSHWK